MPRPSPCAWRMTCPSSSSTSTRRTTSGAWPWARPWAPGSTVVTRHEPDGRRRAAHGARPGGPGARAGGGAADTIKARERDGEIGADEGRRELDHLQKVTDRWIDEVERIGKAKEQEVLEVS